QGAGAGAGLGLAGDAFPGGAAVFGEPGGGGFEALLELDLRGPAEEGLGAADIGLAAPRVVDREREVDELRIGAGEGEDAFHEVADGELVGVAEVYRAVGDVAVHQALQAIDQVADVAEAASLRAAAVDGDVVAGERLADDVRDHPAVVGAHAGAVGVEDPGDADVGAAGALE